MTFCGRYLLILLSIHDVFKRHLRVMLGIFQKPKMRAATSGCVPGSESLPTEQQGSLVNCIVHANKRTERNETSGVLAITAAMASQLVCLVTVNITKAAQCPLTHPPTPPGRSPIPLGGGGGHAQGDAAGPQARARSRVVWAPRGPVIGGQCSLQQVPLFCS